MQLKVNILKTILHNTTVDWEMFLKKWEAKILNKICRRLKIVNLQVMSIVTVAMLLFSNVKG